MGDLPLAEHVLDDLGHALVLEDAVLAPEPQEREARLELDVDPGLVRVEAGDLDRRHDPLDASPGLARVQDHGGLGHLDHER